MYSFFGESNGGPCFSIAISYVQVKLALAYVNKHIGLLHKSPYISSIVWFIICHWFALYITLAYDTNIYLIMGLSSTHRLTGD